MTYESQAADDIIRFSMGGIRTASRIMGDFSHRILRLIFFCVRDSSKSRGREKVKSMVKSEKDLKIVSLRDDDLEKFCRSASRMDITYCIIKSSDLNGISHILIFASDSNRVSKIMKRLDIEKVDVGLKYPVKKETAVLNPAPKIEEKGNSLNPTDERKTEKSASQPTLSQYKDDSFRALPVKERMEMVNREAETTLSQLRERPMNLPKKAPAEKEVKAPEISLPLTVAKVRDKS